MDYPKFKVCVSCFTYNQAKFITDAMNGFTMQQTSFPFVCTIVDDASTDGEQDVIRKYLQDNFDFSEGAEAYEKETDYAHITYARHKTNRNCFFAVLLLKENLYSKRQGFKKAVYISEWRDPCEYEALCEGDDYWIVPDKLQKQVEFMMREKNCSLVFTNAEVKYEVDCAAKNSDMYSHLQSKKYSGIEILAKWTVPTATVLFRREVVSKIPADSRFLFGDIVLFLTATNIGDVHCINEKTACYRRNAGGVSFRKNDYKKYFNHYQAIVDHFGEAYSKVVIDFQSTHLVGGFLKGHLRGESWKCLYMSLHNAKLFSSFVRKLFHFFIQRIGRFLGID